MDSLRRLTSSVFDGNSRLSLGSVGRKTNGNITQDAKHLDLTFITDRLLVSGFPVNGPTDKKANQLNIDDLAQYLETHHANHYLILNLNSLEEIQLPFKGSGGNQYSRFSTDESMNVASSSIAGKVKQQMLEFSWERDGMKAHTPPFDLIFRICYAIFAWLSLDAANVAVVHCQTGKTRSGIVIACYLLYARLVDDPTEAFVEFYRKRWDMRTLTPQALRNKTPPSIQRFLTCFHELIETQKPRHEKPMLLKAIIFRALPVEMQPCVQIWDDHKMIFCTESLPFGNDGNGSKDNTPVLDWNGDDGFFAILWENGMDLDGGFSILCSFAEDYETSEDVDASSRVLFRYADSTWFLDPGLITLKKNKLDMMKQYEHGFDDEYFSVDLVVHENPSKPRKNYVPIDYTGNNAVRQGVIEITKHHLVLPDPAMHSNFIKMGFSETATTFALQRSQNAPNVALDLLHSEGLAGCFAREKVVASSPEDGEENNDFGDKKDDPVTPSKPPMIRRKSTAEIVAMQSQRSRYSIPTAIDSSICDTCKEDDYMMRPQIVKCTGRCGKYYHTTCVGLRKIPFGLTTLSDRTNHGIYVKKFFSAWECDSCGPSLSNSSPVEIPAGMTLVPSAWVNELALSASTTSISQTSTLSSISLTTHHTGVETRMAETSSAHAAGRDAQVFPQPGANHVDIAATIKKHEIAKDGTSMDTLDKLKEFLAVSGVSVEDLLRAATSPNVAIVPSPTKVGQGVINRDGAEILPSIRSIDMNSISSDYPPRNVTPTRLAEDGVKPELGQGQLPKSPSTRSDGNAQTLSADMGESLSNKNETVKVSETLVTNSTLNVADECVGEPVEKYTLMLKRGVPFAAVQNCMVRDGVDPSTLRPLELVDGDQQSDRAVSRETATTNMKTKLKDIEEYQAYFNMIRLGCPKDAVKQKLMMDGLDPVIIDMGPDAIYEDVKERICDARPAGERSKLQDDIKSVRPTQKSEQEHEKLLGQEEDAKEVLESSATRTTDETTLLKDHEVYSKYFKMIKMGLPEGAVRHKMKADGVDERVLDLGENTSVSALVGSPEIESVKLQDDSVYGKYFKMLKMGLPEGAVRHKMKAEGVDERALDLGGDAFVSALAESPEIKSIKLQDDSVYGKYFKMLKMGLPLGAVRHKMIQENADPRALDLGPDGLVSQLATAEQTSNAKVTQLKPKRRRKKLHWQPISEDRLSGINQQTIWEDKDDDAIEFEMDMDELEQLFFANNDTGSMGSKRKSSQGQLKPLKRKQAVTLIDGKRAMNAAISLARVKLTYNEIANAVITFNPNGLTVQQLIGINEFLPTVEEVSIVSGYTGDAALLGEAEKFMFEISKVKRYRPRMECLVYKLSFPSQSSELMSSLAHIRKACEEVKGSRLLKILLGMVLKLGNTLNGSGNDNEIRGFTVDSLLRLGHTKAVNQKTTVLHYLVRIVKKNHPQVLDFQQELQSVILASRESFDSINEDFSKLQVGLSKFQNEIALLEKQHETEPDIATTVDAMKDAATDIEERIQNLDKDIKSAHDEVASVFDYFGEDPNKNPTDFFTTLASFCTAFEAARKEVDTADEVALRAERLKLRRSASVAKSPVKAKENGESGNSQRRILERARSDTSEEAFKAQVTARLG